MLVVVPLNMLMLASMSQKEDLGHQPLKRHGHWQSDFLLIGFCGPAGSGSFHSTSEQVLFE